VIHKFLIGKKNFVSDIQSFNHMFWLKTCCKLKIHQMINSMDLVDVWREKNPGVRRYTWRGPDKKTVDLTIFLCHLT
jgi:hypothetical protein